MSVSTPANREPARTDKEAKDRLLRVLGQSLTTVSKAIWIVAPVAGSDRYNLITAPDVIGLTTMDGRRLFLRSTIQFRYGDDERHKGERKAFTTLYAHTVGETIELKPQLYSWEWNSTGSEWPHVHVRRGDPNFGGLGKLHIPTGRVFYEHVLHFLMAEHGVQPRRADWQKVLRDGFNLVSTYASWGGGTQAPDNDRN